MFLEIVARMGLADAIYSKGKRVPKWTTEEETKAYILGFDYGKNQIK
jgi:hypothetical protein